MRYYILKYPAIWSADSILAHNLRTRILPDTELMLKYQQLLVLNLEYFQEKLMPNFSKEIQKNIGVILGAFTPDFGQKKFNYQFQLSTIMQKIRKN